MKQKKHPATISRRQERRMIRKLQEEPHVLPQLPKFGNQKIFGTRP